MFSDVFEVVLKTPENFNKPNQSRTSTRAYSRRSNVKGYHSKKPPTLRHEQMIEPGQIQENVDNLPSIYSTAPFWTVLEGGYVEHVLSLESKSPAVTLNTPPSTVQPSENVGCVLETEPSSAEMKQLLKMYV